MKYCKDCGIEKRIEEFYTNKRSTAKDGRSVYCIPCHLIRNRAYRARARLTPSGRAGHLLHGARSRAHAAGRIFEITKAWVMDRLSKGVCEVTGIAFDWTSHPSRTNPLAPSIDRLDSTRGYVADNCRLVVWAFNVMRNEFDEEAVARVAEAWLEKRR